MPIQPVPTMIKIEDSVQAGIPALAPFEPKSTNLSAITATKTNEINLDASSHLNNYYSTHGLHGNLIQIAPHTSVSATQTLPNNENCSTLSAGIPLINTIDYRNLQSHVSDVTIPTMSCLTPISETYHTTRCDENLDSSGVSTLPEGKTKIRRFIHFFQYCF